MIQRHFMHLARTESISSTAWSRTSNSLARTVFQAAQASTQMAVSISTGMWRLRSLQDSASMRVHIENIIRRTLLQVRSGITSMRATRSFSLWLSSSRRRSSIQRRSPLTRTIDRSSFRLHCLQMRLSGEEHILLS